METLDFPVSSHSFFFDFDSTLYPGESLEEIIGLALENSSHKNQKLKELERIGQQGMEGMLTITESLKKRLHIAAPTQFHIQQWIDHTPQHVDERLITLLTNLRKKKYTVSILTSGFKEWVFPFMQQYGFSEENIYANTAHVDEQGVMIGFDEKNPLSQDQGKACVLLEKINNNKISGQSIMVGDGVSDLQTKAYVDKFIGFGVYQYRKRVAQEADFFFDDLDTFSHFMTTHFLDEKT